MACHRSVLTLPMILGLTSVLAVGAAGARFVGLPAPEPLTVVARRSGEPWPRRSRRPERSTAAGAKLWQDPSREESRAMAA